MKISLKSRTKSALYGVVGLLISGLIIRHNINTQYMDLAIVSGLGIASLAGYLEGATTAEQIIYEQQGIDTHCSSCDLGPLGHDYDCPEAQE